MKSVASAIEDTRPPAHGQGVGKFRPRARLLKSLGEELISSETVAIIELVRNCYDADATRVEIRFLNVSSPDEATLELWDNGHGMTEDLLLGPWLEPATDHKATGSQGATGGDTSPGGRRRLGSKGVGRFATQRLGRELVLRSRAAGGDHEIEATFDWNELDGADSYLDQLQIPWRRESASYFPEHSGTSLQINRLRDEWNEDRFERLRVGLSRLVSPSLAGQEFVIYVVINGIHEPIRPALDQQHAMYSLEGTIEEGGQARLIYRDITGAEEEWHRRVIWPQGQLSCGPFQFRLNAWDLDREPLEAFLERVHSPLKPRDFKRLLREHSGISLYRDGFRILPYGEADNDWLRLDRRRVNNPTLCFSNNQILGGIQFTAKDNPNLRDQTNREGLVANESYHHLQQVVQEVMNYLESRRFVARRSMNLGAQKRATALPELATSVDREIDRLVKDMETGTVFGKTQLVQLKDKLDERRTAVAGAVQHYSSLATSGLVSGVVFTQLQHPMQRLRNELRLMQADLEDNEPTPDVMADMRQSIAKAMALLEDLQRRTQKMDPFMVARQNRKSVLVQLAGCVNEVLDVYADRLATVGVTAELYDSDQARLVTRADVLQQALANIIDNAVYWLEQAEGSRNLRVTINENAVIVENNGPKIPKQNLPHVLEPHFTTKPDGTGLGLTIARDLLLSINAVLYPRNTDFGVAMEISFKRD